MQISKISQLVALLVLAAPVFAHKTTPDQSSVAQTPDHGTQSGVDGSSKGSDPAEVPAAPASARVLQRLPRIAKEKKNPSPLEARATTYDSDDDDDDNDGPIPGPPPERRPRNRLSHRKTKHIVARSGGHGVNSPPGSPDRPSSPAGPDSPFGRSRTKSRSCRATRKAKTAAARN
ncbi:hypothetical protein PspLS_01706 [Pyricularia sp. CBS 133598]|nr:hypothetical protein PspLS_01706 [Pyricularia sp. CBS 133598]